MARHLIGEILGLWRSAAAFAGDRWRAKEEMREVDALDPQERARTLGEVGLTRQELGDALRTPFVSQDLLSKAIRAVTVDHPDALRARHGAWERDMQRACMACPARGRCRRDLATGDFARRYRHYCLNADNLAEIAAAASKALAAPRIGRA